jgi:hypothetical protein
MTKKKNIYKNRAVPFLEKDRRKNEEETIKNISKNIQF